MKNTKGVNERQKEFYNSKRKNIPTRIWSHFRNGILNKTRKSIGIEKEIIQLHIQWLGNLEHKKVLDLGCYEGNQLSIFLARNSKRYIGIDLSEKGISRLGKKIEHIDSAQALAVDFLSDDFEEKDFDLIYAYGVLHHFSDTDLLISRLQEKLTSTGQIISYDPLKTSLPIKILRAIYRPFQSDKEWEWPFSQRIFHKFQSAFEIKERRAILGKSKWFFFLQFLPISSGRKISIAKKWHQQDWEGSKDSNSVLFSCMHLTMLMQKRIL